jgi:hypothetical protein
MKYKCLCGEIITDNTDCLYYKARCIADQDWDDFLESKLVDGGHDWRLTRTIYQCPKCGRLQFERHDGQLVFFKLEKETEENKKLLCSVKGLQWKRPLVGVWNSLEKLKQIAKGRIYFQNCFNEGFEKFDDWTALEKRYFEILEQLKQSNTLRSALLKKDGKLLHQWPQTSTNPK